jgi:uncharacterized protein (DUF4415 family)
MPAEFRAWAKRNRGPQNKSTKVQISICLSRDALSRFRATGEGWQTRMDEALRGWVESPGGRV